MPVLGLETHVVDQATYDNSVGRFREAGILLPTLSQLADPTALPAGVVNALEKVDRDAPHPLNLFRVHWYNRADGHGRVDVPGHVVLPEALTGVRAKIVLAFGNRFPMIHAHKVLAAYACLVPRVITGQFDPTKHKAVWPSTGNYCRGGVAISRIMNCRGVAVLPAGMSAERFHWLEKWVAHPDDIIRTPGTESNVKEIYDKCAELERDPQNVIFNQFAEFANYLVHAGCTGPALGRVFEHLKSQQPQLTLRAFTSATGSAGTIAAGDWLKDEYGAKIVAVEAQECPTLLENGFGEHNIQGIGDKHVPLIHNVMNTDLVAAISDVATDELDLLFNSEVGRRYLVERRGVPKATVDLLGHLGLSSICNLLAAIKTARWYGYGPDDVIVTVATDGSELYHSEHARSLARRFPKGMDEVGAGEIFGQHLLGQNVDHLMELNHHDRLRVFNLGYFTWVEQQGISSEEFTARRSPEFWRGLRKLPAAWDAMIDDFNRRTGAAARYA